MSQEKVLTPREAFLNEKKKFDAYNIEEESLDPELEKEVDELMEQTKGEEVLVPNEQTETQKLVDKSMGNVKVSQFDPKQAEDLKLKQEAMLAFQQLNELKKPHLKPEEREKLLKHFKEFKEGKVKDPILLHLFQQKTKKTEDHNRRQDEVRELNNELLKLMTQTTAESIKTKSIVEHIDREILEYLDQKA